jgi:plastocyanin
MMTSATCRSLGLRSGFRSGFRALGIRLAVAAAIVLPLGVIGADAEDMKVTIDNFTFAPAELKVKVGDTVTWTNHDDIPHTVVSAGKFRSKTMDTDNDFSFTFTAAGDYKYFCSLHPHMTGMIKVE